MSFRVHFAFLIAVTIFIPINGIENFGFVFYSIHFNDVKYFTVFLFVFLWGLVASEHLFFPWDMISLCSSGWPETHYVDQAGIEYIEICPPLPPDWCTEHFLVNLSQFYFFGKCQYRYLPIFNPTIGNSWFCFFVTSLCELLILDDNSWSITRFVYSLSAAILFPPLWGEWLQFNTTLQVDILFCCLCLCCHTWTRPLK